MARPTATLGPQSSPANRHPDVWVRDALAVQAEDSHRPEETPPTGPWPLPLCRLGNDPQLGTGPSRTEPRPGPWLKHGEPTRARPSVAIVLGELLTPRGTGGASGEGRAGS